MAKPQIYILLGANHNMLGDREPNLYGTQTISDVENLCRSEAKELGCNIEFRQSNHEGHLIDWLQEADNKAQGVVLNASAFSRTSLVLQSTVSAMAVPVIEVHTTNIYQRDDRPPSQLTCVAVGIICGFGPNVYRLGMHAVRNLMD